MPSRVRFRPVLWSVTRSSPRAVGPAFASTRSTTPRSRQPPAAVTGSGRLRGSRPPPGGRPKPSSACTGIHSPSSLATCRSQPLRSPRKASISSRQTRSIAGASRSAYSAATRSSTASATASAAGTRAAVTGSSARRSSVLTRSACTSWNRLPRVSGSSFSMGGSTSSRGLSRCTADSRNLYGQTAKCCRADGEYGRAVRRCAASNAFVSSSISHSPSWRDQADFHLVQRAASVRRRPGLSANR